MIEMIVAHDIERAIGRNNKLLWRLKDDMKHFVKTTKGKNVVMGRKTFESLPAPLKGRKNYVLSNTIKMSYYEGETYVEFLTYEDLIGKLTDYIVIGGAEIYELFFPHVDVLHKTLVASYEEDNNPADAFFPEMSRLMPFVCVEEKFYPVNKDNECPFIIVKLVRALPSKHS